MRALAVDGPNDGRERARDGDIGLGGEGDFVAEVAVPIEPVVQPDPGRDARYIVQEKAWIGLSGAGKRGVQLEDEAGSSSAGNRIPVAKDGVSRHLEIVLDNLSRKVLVDGLPNLPVTREFCIQIALQVGGRCTHRWHVLHVELGGVDVDDVRRKLDQVGRVMDGVLVETAILGLVESRLKSRGEEQYLQQLDDLIGGGTAENCDADLLQAFVGGELAAQTFPLEQEIVNGKLIDAHKGRNLTSLEYPARMPLSTVPAGSG